MWIRGGGEYARRGGGNDDGGVYWNSVLMAPKGARCESCDEKWLLLLLLERRKEQRGGCIEERDPITFHLQRKSNEIAW